MLCVEASSSAGTAATIGPTMGTNSSTAAMKPRPSADGTPMKASPVPIITPTMIMARSCAPSHSRSASPASSTVSAIFGCTRLGNSIMRPLR